MDFVQVGSNDARSTSTMSDTVEVVSVEGESGSKKMGVGKWSDEEHERYLKAMKLYDENRETISEKWKFIQEIIMTRSITQCRSHHQKHELKLKQIESRKQLKTQQQHLVESHLQPQQRMEQYRTYPLMYQRHLQSSSPPLPLANTVSGYHQQSQYWPPPSPPPGYYYPNQIFIQQPHMSTMSLNNYYYATLP